MSTFTKHCEISVDKANGILGRIKSTFTFLDGPSLKSLYTALVRNHLEYCNVVWAPKYLKDSRLVENVQKRATKLVPGMESLSYQGRLKVLHIPSLKYRRQRGDMIQVYKYLHNKYTVPNDILELENKKCRTRGHSLKLKKTRATKEVRSNYFAVRVVNLWNSLPEEVIDAPTLNCFKNRLDKHWKHLTYDID